MQKVWNSLNNLMLSYVRSILSASGVLFHCRHSMLQMYGGGHLNKKVGDELEQVGVSLIGLYGT